MPNITLNGVPVSSPVPGATVTYQIYYSNAGPAAAINMIIYDQMPGDVIYSSIIPTAWTEQFSYSALPDQSWGSSVYSNTPPGQATNVRWIRWINASVPAGTGGSFTYSVIVK